MFKQITMFAAFAALFATGAMVFDRQSQGNSGGGGQAARPAQEKAARSGRAIVAITADRGGQFLVSTLVDGVHVEMLADTGASAVALTDDDARRIGIDMSALDYSVRVKTANGMAMAAPVTLDEVSVGGITLRDVRGMVGQPGSLHISLLGMTFIGNVARFELRGDQLILSD